MRKDRSLEVLLSMTMILFCDSASSLAQTANSAIPKKPAAGFIRNVGSDVAHVFSSPFHLSRRGGLRLLAVAAVTAGTIAFVDEPFDEEYAKEGHNIFYLAHELAEIGQFYDDVSPVSFTIGLSAATLVGGLLSKDKKLLTTTRLLVESAVLTEFFTALSKGVLGRSRPYTDRGATDFHFFKFSSSEELKSMPSGHVSSVFAIMTVMAKQYDYWWVEIPAYTFCGAVAFQRMESRNHWFSDTIVGGALGYWVASTLVNHNRGVATNSFFRPYWLGNRVGAVLSF
jgi:membrane-associated phospholipid phosphatase